MYKIIVDKSNKVGAIKPLHCVNGPPLKYIWKCQEKSFYEDYAELKIPYSRNHDEALYNQYGLNHVVDIKNIFTDFSADVNNPDSYDFALTDEIITITEEVGTKTFYRLGTSIEHWSKKYGSLPPTDYKKWAQICEHIIRHYNEGWANGFHYNLQYWEIWNEPDADLDDDIDKRCWGGTKQEFFEFYVVAAKYLKECFPDLMIGGPAISGNMEWARDFLDYLKKMECPLDFFSWHIYCTYPAPMVERAQIVRRLLDESGFKDTLSILNEWNYNKDWEGPEFVYSLKQLAGQKGASLMAACMCEGQRISIIDMMMYYDVLTGEWNGVFDRTTYCRKNGWYSLKFFSDLYQAGTEVKCQNDNDKLYCTCAVDSNNKLELLLVYHTDEEHLDTEREIKIELKGMECAVLQQHYISEKQNIIGSLMVDKTGVLTLSMVPNSFVKLTE